jgi:hypothetical protein
LTTDIASPERTQLGKSKWKEAFGDPYETVERKVMKEVQKRKLKADSAEVILDEMKIKSEQQDDSSVSLESEDDDDGNGPKRVSRRMKKRENGGDTSSEDLEASLSGKALKFHRRLSQVGTNTPAITPPRNKRLGFRRTMDLSGASIETYDPNKRCSASSDEYSLQSKFELPPPEEIDDMRESVIMETIIKSADVAHNLQGFEQMAKWSDCLYLELRKAFIEEKGDDPMNGWFNNQIGFLDFYLLPLARMLDDTGAFGDTRGGVFAAMVERNRKRWTREGMSVTMKIIMEGNKQYPEKDDD